MRAVIDFLLYDWLRVDALSALPRFADHSQSTFSQVMDLAERIAAEKFAPYDRLADTEEPSFDGERVSLPAATVDAVQTLLRSGLLAATQDYDLDGMQLPCVIAMAANAFVSKASNSLSGYGMLTAANAGLILAHGTPEQRHAFARRELEGDWTGTMCMSEPHAGSSLGDLTTRAEPDGTEFGSDPLGPRYRLFGSKMWISGGDHEITENIVHLVLAKIPLADGTLPSGVKGLSLFIVPKFMLDSDGNLTQVRNDVALAGLNHKLGCRGIPNTVLKFGDGTYSANGAGAVGYRIGAPGEGLKCMFHMMNEARIGVGMGAVMLGYAGYEVSLEYAKTRLQGRQLGVAGKNTSEPPVPIIRHADVKRMLLAQKSYVEGGLALGLYCAHLLDRAEYGDQDKREDCKALLELLLPIMKSWPSEWCLEANSLAIQVLGGAGYTRDFPVEQYWRDNRLNMIHEGTHGIQGLDLLGRKVLLENGRSMRLLAAEITSTVQRAERWPELTSHAEALHQAFSKLVHATNDAWTDKVAEVALANATDYLRAFGHIVLAWTWLDVAIVAHERLEGGADANSMLGKIAASDYFFIHELPKTRHWLQLAASGDTTCLTVEPDWF